MKRSDGWSASDSPERAAESRVASSRIWGVGTARVRSRPGGSAKAGEGARFACSKATFAGSSFGIVEQRRRDGREGERAGGGSCTRSFDWIRVGSSRVDRGPAVGGGNRSRDLPAPDGDR